MSNQPPARDEESEVTILRNKINRLEIVHRVYRRAYADLVAAARAALTAHADGEPDPWSYLRDELPRPPAGHPLSDDRSRPGGRR